MGALRDWIFSCAKIGADTSEDMLNGMYANIIEIASIKKIFNYLLIISDTY